MKKAEFEVFFNDFAPFYHCTELYVAVFLLGVFSWIGFRTPLARSAFLLCLVTLVLHSWAIGARMYIQGRPPVTNLYSSAVFIGWGCVGAGPVPGSDFPQRHRQRLARRCWGSSTLLIAHHLASGGDTMEMMRAVLDTNFWLATHVVCVTIGYAATFVAGFLGDLLYIGMRRLHASRWTRDRFKALSQMIYGIVCFATLLELYRHGAGRHLGGPVVGPLLGLGPEGERGAADRDLERADPARPLGRHGQAARHGGAGVVGNMVDGWSWFGTNQLGVGLHAYAGQTSTKDLATAVYRIAGGVNHPRPDAVPRLLENCRSDTPVKLPPPDSPILQKRGQRGRSRLRGSRNRANSARHAEHALLGNVANLP